MPCAVIAVRGPGAGEALLVLAWNRTARSIRPSMARTGTAIAMSRTCAPPQALAMSPPPALPSPSPVRAQRIPLPLKLASTGFVALLVPIFSKRYGATNFLYFCDCALLMTVVGAWLESPLLISMPAVGIIAVQTLWMVDFLGHAIGLQVLGMTDYMFISSTSLFLRGLSLFHAWLPLLLLWLVHRIGYDPRALPAWTALGTALLIISYSCLPPPAPHDHPLEPVNVNLVFGFSGARPQSARPALWYLLLLIAAMPVLCYLPTHALLKGWCGPAPAAQRDMEPVASGHASA
jgi:hypothetical protein